MGDHHGPSPTLVSSWARLYHSHQVQTLNSDHYPDDVMKTVSVTCQSAAFQRQERIESRVQTLAQTTHSFTFFSTSLAVLQRCNDRYRILFYLSACHTPFYCFCRYRCAKRPLSNPNNHSRSSCIACMSSRAILKSVVHLVAPLQIQ